MRQLLIVTGPYLNTKLLCHTAKPYFCNAEILQASELYLGRIQKFFANTDQSRLMVIVDAGNFMGGYQRLLGLVQSVEVEKYYLTNVASDCPLDEQGQLCCHVLKGEDIFAYTVKIIEGSHDS